MLAIKFNEDDYYSNEFYSKVGGITNQELNYLESEAYKLMDYSLWVDLVFYENYEIFLKQFKIVNNNDHDFDLKVI